MFDISHIKSRMEAYYWADTHGFKYYRSRIGFSVYRNTIDRHIFEIGDYHCAIYRTGKGTKADRLQTKRTYDQR